jgi:hypothetical protein
MNVNLFSDFCSFSFSLRLFSAAMSVSLNRGESRFHVLVILKQGFRNDQ